MEKGVFLIHYTVLKPPFNGLKGDGDINIPAVSELSKSNNKHNCL